MIKIEKKTEPHSWTKHRLTEGAKYEATSDLRNALLSDQGYLCALSDWDRLCYHLLSRRYVVHICAP